MNTGRLNALAELDEYRRTMGTDFCNYRNRVYSLLMRMRKGTFFVFEKNVRPENMELFVKLCCLFILERRMNVDDYVMADDYTLIRRT